MVNAMLCRSTRTAPSQHKQTCQLKLYAESHQNLDIAFALQSKPKKCTITIQLMQAVDTYIWTLASHTSNSLPTSPGYLPPDALNWTQSRLARFLKKESFLNETPSNGQENILSAIYRHQPVFTFPISEDSSGNWNISNRCQR